MSSAAGAELTENPQDEARNGLIAALIAYLSWGVLPIYIKIIAQVPPLEVLSHRVVWAIPFGAAIIALRRQWPEVWRVIRDRSTLLLLVFTAALIAVNWFIYIYAVQIDQVFQASLGYYMTPMMNVVVGLAFFSERLRRYQFAAVVLAAAGVAVLALSGSAFPWIAIALAVSFTTYGVVRKQVRVGGMPGLFIETVVLLPFAGGYLAWIVGSERAAFAAGNPGLDATLLLAGPFTVLPLLMFALAARRLQLTTIGILQFIAPSMQFLLGIYYGEELTRAGMVCFACIWIAMSLFAWDAWRESRRIRALRLAARV